MAGAGRGSPVVAQVGEHEVEQAGDEGHGLLLLITAVNHVQQGGQHLQNAQGNSPHPQLALLQKGKACHASGWKFGQWNSPQKIYTAV